MLLLAGCGSGQQSNEQAVDLPLPSGPPLVQQVDAVPSSAPDGAGPAWETAAGGEGTALRLTEPGGRLLLSIACTGSPPRLAVSAPAFNPVGSEDRMSFGLGNEPLALVADPTRQSKGGVTGEGPVPEEFTRLLEAAGEVSAVYGTQSVGPVPAPADALKQMLAASCSGSDRRAHPRP